MATMQILKRKIPYKIWHFQSCSNCGRVLSSAKVMLSSKVHHVCGKCVRLPKYRKLEFVNSLYNVVASEYSFSCVNCYAGCNRDCSFSEMLYHKELCRRIEEQPSDKLCQFCPFRGSKTFEIVIHIRKNHLKHSLFEGAKLVFSITDDQYRRIIYFLEDGCFLCHWNYYSSNMILNIRIESVSLPKPRIFSVKIGYPEDPTNYKLLQITSIDLVEFNLDYNQLNEEFGFGTVLSYELIVENLPMDDSCSYLKEYVKVRKQEQAIEMNYKTYEAEKKKQNNRDNTYNMTIDIIKYIAPSMLKCSNCNTVNPGMKLYFCSEGHICCRACIHPKCEACKDHREFNLLDELQQLVVECDWPGCEFETELHYFMSHKAACSRRTYVCPLKGCYDCFTSIQELPGHWHACTPSLIESDSSIVFNKSTHQEYFWACNYDIYRVIAKIDEEIQIIIENFDVVLVNNKICCYGITEGVKRELPSSIFCDCFQVSIDNRQTNTPSQFIYDQVEIQIVRRDL